jgi:demethylmenaquinone methyltransferase/2-methoxy-6-polyprenyl-1,4-benzoquinol methylase
MFERVARRYDLLNRLISLGQDRGWRRRTVRRLDPAAGQRVLDLGAGTGDLALEIARAATEVQIVAADFTREMVAIGRRRSGSAPVRWLIAEAGKLPFRQTAFDAVGSAFLLRNLSSVEPALSDQLRVLKPGGRWAALDTTPAGAGLLRPLIELHFRVVIPLLGRLVAGQPQAYRYLPASTRGFLPAEALAARVRQAGFEQVGFERLMLGTVAIHWGVRGAGPLDRGVSTGRVAG